MSCIFKNPHNSERELQLAKTLRKYYNLGNSQSDNLFLDSKLAQFYTESFKERFGNWLDIEQAKTFGNRVNEFYEVKLYKDGNNFYVIDKNNDKFYINNRTFEGLEKYFPFEEISIIQDEGVRGIVRYIFDKHLNEEDDITDIENVSFDLKKEISLYFEDLLEKYPSYDHLKVISLFQQDFAIATKDFLKTLNLKYIETNEQDEQDYKENNNSVLEKPSIEKNSKDNATGNVKLMLSLLSNTSDRSDNNVQEYFPGYKVMNFDDVWADVQITLLNMPKILNAEGNKVLNPYDIIVQRLNDLAIKKPYINDLLYKLEDSNKNTQIQFVQAFFNTGKMYQDTLVARRHGDIITYDLLDASESSSKKNKLINEASINFKELYSVGNKLDGTALKYFVNFYKQIESQIKSKLATDTNLENIDEYYKLFKEVSDQLGFIIPDDNAKSILDLYFKNGDVTNSLTYSMFKNKINGYFKSIDYLFTEILGTVDSKKLEGYADAYINSRNVVFDKNGNYKNPFKGKIGQKELVDLAESISEYNYDINDNTFMSGDKNLYAYSMMSHLFDRVNILNTSKEEVKKLSKSYNNSSRWIKKMLSNIEQGLPTFVVHRNNSMKKDGSDEVQDTVSTSKADAVARTLYELLLPKLKRKPIYATPVSADKPSVNKLEIDDFINTTDLVNGELQLTEEVVEQFINYFEDSLRENKLAKEFILSNVKDDGKIDISKLRQYYHLNDGKVFDVLDANGDSIFNKGSNTFKNNANLELDRNSYNDVLRFTNENTEYTYVFTGNVFKNTVFGSLSPDVLENTNRDIFHMLYDNDYSVLNTALNPVNGKIISTARSFIKEHFTEMLHNYVQSELEYLVKTGIFNKNYTNNVFDTNVLNVYKEETGNNEQLAVQKLVYDSALNGAISQLEYSIVFNGSIAAHKNPVDYSKRVPKTYIDGKGLVLGYKENDHISYVAVLQDSIVDSKYIDSMGKKGKEYYKGINQADASGMITVKRWKFLLEGLGMFNKFERSIYDKIINDQPLTIKEIKKLSTKPIKGVYFSNENDKALYLKYSQAILIPSLIKGTPLERLLKEMEAKDISEVIFESGVKVGAQMSEDNVTQKILNREQFNLSPIQIDNRFWKLQQELPSKGIKETLLGSQIQKNVNENIKFDKEDYILRNNKSITGKDLFIQMHTVIGAMSMKGIEKIINKFKIDDNGVIKDYKAFTKAIANQLRQEKLPENVVKAVEKELTPYVIPQAKNKIISTIFSIVNKAATKLKTNGASLIQMSNFGLDYNTAEDTGIVWLKEKQQLSEPTITKSEDGTRDVVNPGQIFIGGNLLTQYVPDWRTRSLDDLFGPLVNGKRQGGLFPKEILTAIGYRIPNQAMSSNDALEIVGILPDSYSDTVIAYTGITTKTGSDYDIDKMYIILPAFKVNYDIKGSVSDYIYNNTKGETNVETIANLRNLFLELTDDNVEFDADSFIDQLNSQEYTNDQIEATLKSQEKQVIEFILNPNNSENKFVKSLHKKLKPEIESVQYEEFETDELGNELDYSQQSSAALSNRLFELYTAVLTDPTTYESLITPIDHQHVKNYITKTLFKEKTVFTDLKVISPFYQIEQKYDFLGGKFGVGQVANQLVDSIMSQYVDLHIDKYLGWGHYKDKQTKIDYKNEDGNVFHENSNLKIFDTITAILNAFVDIAKDPYITKANWNTITTNTGLFLIRAGADYRKVISFLAQPSLREMVFVTNRREGVLSTESSKTVVEELIVKYKRLFKDSYIADLKEIYIEANYTPEEATQRAKEEFNIFEATLNDVEFKQLTLRSKEKGIKIISNKFHKRSIEDLNEHIINEQEEVFSTQYYLDQYLALEEYERLKPYVKSFNKSVISSKYGETGAGKDIPAFLTNSNRLNSVLDSTNTATINNFSEKFFNTNLNILTMLGHYQKNTEQFLNNLINNNPKLLITATDFFRNLYNEIATETVETKDYLDDPMTGKILEEASYSLISSEFSLHKESGDFNYLFGLKSDENNVTLKDTIINARQQQSNYLLDNLEFNSDANFSFIGINNMRIKPKTHTDNLIRGWLELLESEDLNLKTLGEDLVKYAYLQSGFKNNMTSIFQYIPHEVFIKYDFNNYIKSTYDDLIGGKLDSKVFKENILKNNYTNSKLVPTVKATEFDANNKLVTSDINGNKRVSVFVLNNPLRTTHIAEYGENLSLYGTPLFLYFKDGNNLFENKGYIYDVKTDSHKPVYVITNKLGYKSKEGQFNEYSHNILTKSKFEENNISNEEQSFIDRKLDDIKSDGTFISIDDVRIKYKQFKVSNFQKNNVSLQKDNNMEINSNITINEDFSNNIYSKLGNKTQSENVVIKSWGELKDATKAITPQGIVSTRIKNTDEHFGNPFSHDAQGKTQGLIKTESIKEAVEKYIDWVINGANFEKKNLFSVTPIQSVDKKATIKASIATQYIGFGEGINNSSTELYRQQAGKFANTGNYSEKDTIFVSIGGKRGTEQQQKEQQDKTIKEALKAIEDGAILITDNKSYVDSNSYNTGEKRLAQNLTTKGYNYTEKTVDGQVLGVWFKGVLNPLRREWIREQLKSDKLKNKPILYYKELREPSHATALDYLINKYDWNKLNKTISNEIKPGVEELFDENKKLLEENNINKQLFIEMYNEFGEDYIKDYIKKCKR